MTTSPRCCLAVALLIAACNTPGEITVALDRPVTGAADVLVYAIADLVGPCVCGACADQCVDDRCEIACGGQRCPADQLSGVTLSPAPGPWALILDFYDGDGALIASAWTSLTVNTDGASNASPPAVVSDCP